ncbi:MAG: hypothetical protein HRU08_12960, partial [Oleispira sp.]|nr:hypothetical protein [Oleispira sp.]
IGADLIANLAIKAEGKSLSTSEETNLIANDVELNAEENLNLKGEVKALAIAIEAGSIAIEADILAVNSVAFKASKDARFKDSMVGSNKSDIDSIELVTLATEFNIKDFSITAEKTTIEDTTIEVNELNFELGKVDSNNFKLLADSANISYESWNDNNSQWNIGTLELIGKQLSTQNGNWLFNTGNIHATDLTLRESALFSYIADVQAVNLSANESTIYTEKLLLAVAQSLSSIGDRWKILPFSTQSETAAAGTFLLSAAETEFTGSVIQADNFSLTGADSEFNHTEILANTIKLEGQYLSTNEDTLWIANDSINLVTTTADLNNTIKTSSIKIAAENAEVSGHWLISENANISSNQSLNLEALELTANSFVASFEDGAWDDLLVKTNNSDITANNLLISQGTIESTQLSVSAKALTLDENTWLGAHDAIIAADQLNNSGTLLAADELQLNTRKINNQGDIASFAQVNINSSETLNNHGKIISSQLVIDSANITNTNSISSDKLALDYQTIQNTESANLASNNAIYTAKTNTASFTNYGTQIASDSMQWLTAETSSGSYTNAGLLTGTNINFSGLNNVQNGQLIDGNIKGTIHALTNSDAEAIANEGTITIGAEEFTQLGTIKANQLNITRNDFHNEGAIYSHQFNVDPTEKFT